MAGLQALTTPMLSAKWRAVAVLAAVAALSPGCRGCAEGPAVERASAPSIDLDTTTPTDLTGSASADTPLALPTAVTAAQLQRTLGLTLSQRSRAPFLEVMPTAPGRPFTVEQLGKRFWVALGPRGLVASGRSLAPPVALSEAAAAAALRVAMPDFSERAGIPVRSVLLVVDAAADGAAARALYAAARALVPGTVSALVLDGDTPVEVALPSGGGGERPTVAPR